METFEGFIEKIYNYGIEDCYSTILKYNTILAQDFYCYFISYDPFGDKKPKNEWNKDNFMKFIEFNYCYLKSVYVKYILCEIVDNSSVDNIYHHITLFQKFIEKYEK